MAAQTARRSAVFHRLGREAATVSPNKTVCIFWLNGKCNRNPCRFLHCEMPVTCAKRQSHTELSGPEKKKATYICLKNKLVLEKSSIMEKPHEDLGSQDYEKKTLKKILPKNIEERGLNNLEDGLKKCEDITEGSPQNVDQSCGNKGQFHNSVPPVEELRTLACLQGHTKGAVEKSSVMEKPHEDVGSQDCEKKTLKKILPENIEQRGLNTLENGLKKCEDITEGSPQNVDQSSGNKGQFQNSVPRVEELRTLTCLQGHTKAVMGIALPERNNKLYSGSSDGTIRIWDCDTAQCVHVVDLGSEIGCVTSEAGWVFIGMRNVVKAWNTVSGAAYDLDGFTGLIHTMATTDDMLFAGGQDGIILAWKCSNETNFPLQPVSSLQGHTCDVVSLAVGWGWLYSGSKDHSIRVWDHKTLECLMTLDGHANTVTSLICWDQYLFSGSLDCTIKVWALNEEDLEVIYTHNEEHGILSFRGMSDGNGKPILYCSCSDNSVHLYELPSFADRGRLLSKQKVGAMRVGPDGEGLFFTGDQTGLITVWKWLPKLKASHQE